MARLRLSLELALLTALVVYLVSLTFSPPKLSGIEWLNAALCLAGGIAGFAAINRMSRETEPQIVLAFVIVGVGLFGALAGYWRRADWLAAFDTLIYGGFLALLVGTRRHTRWIHPRWMKPLSICISLGVAGAFFVGVS